MYEISELASRTGLSRSTLLYYEKLGLIQAHRQDNGYRCYTEKDMQQLMLLMQLQTAGLSLQGCKQCMHSSIDRKMLQQRLQQLDKEIAEKQKSRTLLASLLGQHSMREWHVQMERQSPEAHLQWLLTQGFTEKQALRLKWLSKDMNEHDIYMADFEKIFTDLQRLGPGSFQDSLQALKTLPSEPEQLLDIGCGKGVTTLFLAEQTVHTQITATDNDEYSLSCLKSAAAAKGVNNRIQTVCASMTDLPFQNEQFDTLWAEGSAYIMGFSHALNSWKPLLKKQGYLIMTELVWLTDSPAPQAKAFWNHAYPDMKNVSQRLEDIQQAGYTLLDHYTLSQEAWHNYLQPLSEQIAQCKAEDFQSNALNDLKTELDIHTQFLGQYGYEMFILQK